MRIYAFLALAVLAAAQTAKFPAEVATDAQLMVARNGVQTALTAGMSTGATSFTVKSATGITANMLLTIDSEIVKVCSVAGTTVSIGHSSCPNVDGRGFDATTAAVHALGARVSAYVDAWHHNAVTAEIKAIEASLSSGGTALTATFYDFAAQSPAESLIAGGINQAITLSPCPPGVGGADTSHYLYLTGASAEAVLITGGTCTSGAASGTVTITPANNHTGVGGYTVKSATAGVQEAINALPSTGGTVVVSGTVTIYGQITVNKQGVRLMGSAFGWANAIGYAPFLSRDNTQIKVADGANLTAAIKVLRGSFNFEGIEVDGNKANQTGGTGHGIWVTADIDRQNFPKLRFGAVINARGDGIRITSEAGRYQDVGTIAHFSVRDCGGNLILLDSTPDWVLDDINIGGAGAAGVGVGISGGGRHVISNAIIDNAKYSISLYNTGRNIIHHVRTDSSAQHAIAFSGTVGDTQIDHVLIEDAGTASAGTYSGFGFLPGGTYNSVLISNCRVRNGNYSVGNTGHALDLDGTITGLIVEGCDFRNIAGTALAGTVPANAIFRDNYGLNLPTMAGAALTPAAGALTLTNQVHHVATGAGNISTINAGTLIVDHLYLIFDGPAPGALVTGGNIAKAATPAAGQLVVLVYDGNTGTWYPNL